MLVTDFLEQQHREIEELLRKVQTAEDADVVMQKRKDLADVVMAHFTSMESIFYKVATQYIDGTAIPRALEEQHIIAYALWRFMQAPMDRTVCAARFDVLKELFMNHMEEQESELLTAIKAEMPRANQLEIGDKIEKSYNDCIRVGYAPLLAKHFALSTVPMPTTQGAAKAKKTVKSLRFVQITQDGPTLAGLTQSGRVYRRCQYTSRWIPATMLPVKAKKAK